MIEIECPWCEAGLSVPADDRAAQTCPECLTTWTFEESPEPALPLAA